jgi:cell volume regulation protein A
MDFFTLIQYFYTFGIIIVVGLLAYWISEKYSLPRVALLLIFGFILGFTRIINRDLFDPMIGSQFPLGETVEIALIIVLFFGGFSVDIPELKGVLRPGVLLAIIGTFITASIVSVVVGLAFPHIFGILTAIIIGTLVAPIDPIAVFSAQETFKLHPKVGTISKFQSGMDDTLVTTVVILICIPIGLMLENPSNISMTHIIWIGVGSFFYLTISSVIIGITIGYLIAVLYLKMEKHLGQILIMLFPFLIFQLSNINIAPGYPLCSGFVAVFLSGFAFGRTLLKKPAEYQAIHKPWKIGFYICEIYCFVLLGSLVRPEVFQIVFIPALIISLVIVFITSPLAINVCTLKTGLSIRDRLYLSNIGLKGLDPAVLAIASFSALGALTNPFLKGINNIINLTFAVILLVNLGQITLLTFFFGKKGYFSRKELVSKSL